MKTIIAAALITMVLLSASIAFTQSFSVQIGANKGPVQPIPFSHKIHAGKLNMACRYCHYGAYKSPWRTSPR